MSSANPVQRLSLGRWLLHRMISIGLMLFLTLVEGILYLFSRETEDPTVPKVREGQPQILNVQQIDARDLTRDTLKEYVKFSRPVILNHVSPEFIESLDRFAPPPDEVLPEGRLLIQQFSLPNLGDLGRWIRHVTGMRVAYMARFTGSYASGYAHIDAFPSYNFYVMRRGSKRIRIVPRQYNHLVRWSPGFDSVFAEDDRADDDHLEWLQMLPGYYDFELYEGQVLLFHNAACGHKFTNLTPKPQIFTIRLFTADASPLILKNDLFNWEGAKSFANYLLQETIIRDTSVIARGTAKDMSSGAAVDRWLQP